MRVSTIFKVIIGFFFVLALFSSRNMALGSAALVRQGFFAGAEQQQGISDAQLRNWFNQNSEDYSVEINGLFRVMAVEGGIPPQEHGRVEAVGRILSAYLGAEQPPFHEQMDLGLNYALWVWESRTKVNYNIIKPVVPIWRTFSRLPQEQSYFTVSFLQQSADGDSEILTALYWQNGVKFQFSFINPWFRHLMYPLQSRSVGFYSLGADLYGRHHCPNAALRYGEFDNRVVGDIPLFPFLADKQFRPIQNEGILVLKSYLSATGMRAFAWNQNDDDRAFFFSELPELEQGFMETFRLRERIQTEDAIFVNADEVRGKLNHHFLFSLYALRDEVGRYLEGDQSTAENRQILAILPRMIELVEREVSSDSIGSAHLLPEGQFEAIQARSEQVATEAIAAVIAQEENAAAAAGGGGAAAEARTSNLSSASEVLANVRSKITAKFRAAREAAHVKQLEEQAAQAEFAKLNRQRISLEAIRERYLAQVEERGNTINPRTTQELLNALRMELARHRGLVSAGTRIRGSHNAVVMQQEDTGAAVAFGSRRAHGGQADTRASVKTTINLWVARCLQQIRLQPASE
jgi:hypothetical protein